MNLTRLDQLIALLAIELVMANKLLAGPEYRNERRAMVKLMDKLQQR